LGEVGLLSYRIAHALAGLGLDKGAPAAARSDGG